MDEVVEAPPGETVAVGEPEDPDGVDVIIDEVSTAPGLLMTMTVAVTDGESAELGVPVLDGALAWVACSLTDLLPGGDHTIGIGAVTAAQHRAGEPLIWFRGTYGKLA